LLSIVHHVAETGRSGASVPARITEPALFSRWGAFVYRHRRIVLVLAIVTGVVAGSAAGRAASVLSAGGWLDPGSESAHVADRLASEFGAGRAALVAVYRGGAGDDAHSAAFQATVTASLVDLAKDPAVAGTIGFAETGDPRFLANDGHSAYVVVDLNVTDEESVDLLPRFRSEIHQPTGGIDLLLGGYAPLTSDSSLQSERDLVQAETVSLPIAAFVLILVFTSLIAAGIPLLVAGLAIPTTLALVWVVGQQVQLSIYVQNVSTMLGLALAIDYSLFMVSRFREELRKGRSVGQAVEIAVATSGKAVTFSGLAVAIGLGGLLVFSAPALRSFGIGGMLTVFSSLFFALTFLPALLGILGHRVNSLSVRGLIDRIRRATGRSPRDASAAASRSRWERMANSVMAHPVAVLVPTLALLVFAGSPFLNLKQGIPDASTLPPGLESREAALAIQNGFEAGTTTPIVALVDVAGDPTSAANVRALVGYSERLAAIHGIERVESPFSGIPNPQTFAPFTTEQLVLLYGQPRATWPAQLGAFWDRYVRGSTVRLDAISPLVSSSPAGTAVITDVRALSAGPGLVVAIGGSAATGHDFLVAQSDRIPLAVVIVIIAMGAILFLLFGSVVLPVKAIFMTLLSISASFGAMVWIFQEGNLSGPLGFTAPGFTIAGNPIIMFSILFGLSMDYEVLLLSRVQEAWRRTGDNRASVAEGLAKTAGVITGAAAIMVSVFAAFALAQTLTIKSIGVGMAIAVFVDATIVRVLLVPATMRLLGKWNWWAPGPLAAFADRVGFSHVEDQATVSTGDEPPADTDDADGAAESPGAGRHAAEPA
jgi:RND superfamily putative drug exporter